MLFLTLSQADKLGKFVTIANTVDLTAGVTNGVVIGATHLQQIERINADPTLSPAQKRQHVQAVMTQAVATGGLIVVGHGLGSRAVQRQAVDAVADSQAALNNMARSVPTSEIDALLVKHGGARVRWAASELDGVAARRLLSELDATTINSLQSVSGKQAFALLDALGAARLQRVVGQVGAQRLTNIVEALGGEAAAGVITRTSHNPARLTKIGDNIEALVSMTQARASELRVPPKRGERTRGPVLSVLLDLKTGRTFEGLNNPDKLIPANPHPIIAKRLEEFKRRFPTDADNPHYSVPGSHSEIYALDKALKAREAMGMKVTEADLDDFVIHNEWLKKEPGAAKACQNCTHLLNGVEVLPGKR